MRKTKLVETLCPKTSGKSLCLLSWLLPYQVLAANIIPTVVESDAVLGIGAPLRVKVEIGQTKYWRFNCGGNVADAVITLSSYSEHADPLLMISLDPDVIPRLISTIPSSVRQWREDAVGDHYVIAQALGPRGGVIGLMNTRHLGEEELNGVLNVRCSTIVAFDAFFFDNLRNSHVCPVGGGKDPNRFCSGHGHCGPRGLCVCGGNYAGPACEYKQQDIVVVTNATYQVSVPTGNYQYFRVRVPPRFAGGILQIDTASEVPVVVLVRHEGLPTKNIFDTSNFDAWVGQKNTSTLTVKVPASLGYRATTQADTQDYGIHCPKMVPVLDVCYSAAPAVQCKESCQQCIKCVPTNVEIDRDSCSAVCEICKSEVCISRLAACATQLSCTSPGVRSCETSCGACMDCFDSNDPICKTDACECCSSCLPVAAKCGFLKRDIMQYNPYVYVGLFNHRRLYSYSQNVGIGVRFTLKEEVDGAQLDVPRPSWFAALHDPFHDLRLLSTSMNQVYPEGKRFIYNFTVGGAAEQMEQSSKVWLFRDRVTMLHLQDVGSGDLVELSFALGPNISYVLASSRAAPKTFFDFDQVYIQPGSVVQLRAVGGRSLWCAIFAAADAAVQVEARVVERTDGMDQLERIGETAVVVCASILAILCGAAVLISAQMGATRVGERTGIDVNVPFTERLNGLLTEQRDPGSMTSLMRVLPFGGGATMYNDISEEDRYLQRGGWDDDGI